MCTWLVELRSGSSKSLQDFCCRYQTRVCSYICVRFGRPVDPACEVEWIAQEALEKVFTQIQELDDDGSWKIDSLEQLEARIFLSAKHAIIDSNRRYTRRQKLLLGMSPEAPSVDSPGGNNDDTIHKVRVVLKKLPPEFRDILKDKSNDLTGKEMSVKHGISIDLVYQRVKRASELFRKIWNDLAAQDSFDDPDPTE